MLPKLIFRFAPGYNQIMKDYGKENYPNPPEIIEFKDQLEKEWKKQETKVLETLQRISGLKWQEKEIIVYTVGRHFPFSEPLTIPVRKDIKHAVDVLTHELIHRLWVYGDPTKSIYKYYESKYQKYSDITLVHVPLLAIHFKLMEELFPERIQAEKEALSTHIDYKRAVEIVEKVGVDQIVNEFKSIK